MTFIASQCYYEAEESGPIAVTGQTEEEAVQNLISAIEEKHHSSDMDFFLCFPQEMYVYYLGIEGHAPRPITIFIENKEEYNRYQASQEYRNRLTRALADGVLTTEELEDKLKEAPNFTFTPRWGFKKRAW